MPLNNLTFNTEVTIPLPIPIELGGTGSPEQNFIDLNSNQTINAPKNFTDLSIGANKPYKFNDSHSFGTSFDNLENGIFSGDSASVDGILKGWHVVTSTNTRGGGFGVQLALSDTSTDFFYRRKAGGNWLSWQRLWTDFNFNPANHTQSFTNDTPAICRSYGSITDPTNRGLEIQSDSPNSAYMTLYIGGQFKCGFGIDSSDNSLRLGGWSYGNASYRVWNETYGTPVWQAPSDKRLKNSIKPIPTASALDLISGFNPVQFRYTAEVRKTGIFGDLKLRCQPHYGFLAQELPTNNLLLTKSNGELGINYVEIIPLLVAAVQEQQAQIEALKESISNFRKKIYNDD